MMSIILIYQALPTGGAEVIPASSYVWLALAGLLLVGLGAGLMYACMRRRMTRKLERQKTQLDNAWFKKLSEKEQSFFVKMSEELREPLLQIIIPMQMLEHELLLPAAHKQVRMVLRNAQTLMHRVNMMLDARHLSPDGHLLPAFTPPEMPEPKASEALVTYEPLSTLRKQNETADTEATTAPGSAAVANTATAAVTPEAEAGTTSVQEAVAGTQPDEKAIGASDAEVDDSNAAAVAGWAEEQQPEPEKPEEHKFTILMVDDSPDMCRFVHDFFRGVYNVLTASNGKEAIKALTKNDDIDLVVSDLTMPEMDGFELCRHIKTDLRWSHIPVILLTGRTGEEMEVEGLKMGADDYVTKPFFPDVLRQRVKKLIETKENRQKKFWAELDLSPGDLTITSVDAEFLQKVIQVCEDRISDTDFSVEALGHELNMSRTYLYKKMMHITGKGPGEFIRTIRLRRGKRLMELPHLQIADVATALGYSSPKRFSENFKAEFGILPSEYLRQIKAEKTAKKGE